MERKWTYRQYHFQYNVDFAQKYVIMYYNKNRFRVLPFCGTHYKPHSARRLSKHYHLRFDPQIGNGVCAIFLITRDFVAYKSMLDKHWISGIPSDKQDQYNPVINCTYWPVLGPFENLNIIQFSQKSTPYDAFDEIHQVVLYGIS